jgi:methionyl-tRNA formyltransferase
VYFVGLQGQKQVQQYGLKDLQCPGVNSYEFISVLQTLKPDVLLVGSWGEIIKRHLIEYPGLLLINCHPSKLPAHRGANPYSSVILQGEAETGVTFHRIVPKIDAGPIILQRTIPLESEESGATVRDKCAAAAYEMVKELTTILKGHILEGKPLLEVEQDASLKSYYGQLKVEDGLLNWKHDANAMCLQMRALFPWVACSTYLEGKRRIMFYDPKFVPRTQLSGHPKLPGTILSFQQGRIRIVLADESRDLEVTAYQFSNHQTLWPMWLCRFLAPFLLRPGKRFWNPDSPIEK